MNTIEATLNNSPLLALRVELKRGVEPSTFVAALARENAPPSGPRAALTLREGEHTREFAQFHVTHVLDLGDGRVEVHGADVRERWAQRPVSARFNVTRGGRLEPSTTSAGAPWNLAQAVRALFAAANEPEPDIAGLDAGAIPRDLNFRGATLAHALEAALASAGQSLSVGDDGAVHAARANDGRFEPDAARVMAMSVDDAQPRALEVVGGAALELLTLDEGWEPVVLGDGSDHFPDDEFFPLAQALNAWGISEAQARRACLGDAGFERLVGTTAPRAAARVNALKRHAFRSFRAAPAALARLPWLPVGGVAGDGSLVPAQLRVARDEPLGAAPTHAHEPGFAPGALAPEREPFELDLERGLLHLARPPYALSAATRDDPTFQGRELAGDPAIELTVCAPSTRPAARFTFGEGEPLAVAVPHLTAIYDGDVLLNRDALESAARELAPAVSATPRRRHKLAGLLDTQAGGDVARVVIEADERGLTTLVEQHAAPSGPSPAPEAALGAAQGAVAPLPAGLHQPINAFRAGPLVLRSGDGAPETESYLAAEAAHRDSKTHALELAQLGPLAHGFHVASVEASKAGRWFFVAGVEAVEGHRVRVLGADDAHDLRHDALPLDALSATRRAWPRGYRGVLVSLGEGPRLIDAGPLVSDARGSTGGAASNFVADLEGDKLSAKRAGPLHFLTVLSYSPAHRAWVPSLNLRDEETGSARSGRGLFAERDGRSLGRLTANNQGGPVLADARACEKHVFARGIADDGAYVETSGHLSTESFFKVPGDAVHDAPLRFVPATFEGGVPPWPPFEAEIKYDADAQHRWNKQSRPGLWRVQYRVPFSHAVPPTWKPPVKPPMPPVDAPPAPLWPTFVNACLPEPSLQPIITEHEIWAPSHDWIPAPSACSGEEAPFPGVSLKSAGFAAENAGVPDASVGGAILLPPTRGIAQAQSDSGARDSFFALHPEVVLAFGVPKHAGVGAGRIAGGWNLRLTEQSDLVAQPVNADAQVLTDKSRGLHITGHAQIGKSDAAFATDESAGALRLAEGESEGIAFGKSTKLYCPAPDVLRTDGEISAASAHIAGKLTVDGLIDPTGLELNPVAANPGGVAANTLWLDSGDGNALKWGSNKIATQAYVAAGFQPLDADLTNIAALSGTGFAARTGIFGTWALRALAAGSSRITITNEDGVSGNPTIDANQSAFNLDSIGGTLSVSKGGTGATSASGARTNLDVPPTSRAINNGYGITGGGDLSADRTLAVSLSNSSAFLSTAQSISSAGYADLSGCSVSLAAGTWLIVATMAASAANLAFLAHLAITDASNNIVRETSQGVPASGASGVHQWANLALHAIVSPTSTTTYKLRAARGNTTLTNTYTAQDGSGQGVTNNASTNTDKATGIIAIRIA